MLRRAVSAGSDQAAGNARTGASRPGTSFTGTMASSLSAFLSEAGAQLMAGAPDKEKWIEDLMAILAKEKAHGMFTTPLQRPVPPRRSRRRRVWPG